MFGILDPLGYAKAMANQDQKQLSSILLLIIIAFVFVWVVKYFLIVFSGTEAVLADTASAFAGAFFAFFFLRLAQFFSKIHKREVLHYNSVIVLETELNEIGGIIWDNIFVVDSIVDIISRGNVCWNTLHQIPVDKSHLAKLHNIDLINRLYVLFYDIRRMNDDAEMFNNGYMELRTALIQGHIDHPRYIENTQIMIGQLASYKAFLQLVQNKTLRVFAEVRVLAKKDKPYATSLMHFFISHSLTTVSNTDIEAEIPILRKELEENAAESRKEKDAILATLSKNNRG